jgi:hypothetical protein
MSKTIDEIATGGIRCYVAGVLNKGRNEDWTARRPCAGGRKCWLECAALTAFFTTGTRPVGLCLGPGVREVPEAVFIFVDTEVQR